MKQSWWWTGALIVAGCSPGQIAGSNTGTCVIAADCQAGALCIDGQCVAANPTNPTPTPAGCIDQDGDGRGVGCPEGPDCDDTNPIQTGREVCDELDNDCDGIVDNGVVGACGDCDPSCVSASRGPASGMPWNPDGEESDSVSVDPLDGALILDSREIAANFIWIANTAEGSVSRFNTETLQEEARYITGPDGASNDPSRTSVNGFGDVYIGNRAGNSVSRISILGSECPDTNGDGSVTTSTSGTALPWGQDDCVLWHRNLDSAMPGEGKLRAVAAQDAVGPDGTIRPYVWVGGYETQRIAKIDGDTGEVLFVTPAPVKPYGFALDGHGNLWMATRTEPFQIARIDTNACVDAASCMSARETIGAPHRPYGITVDFRQRVWIGGDNGQSSATRRPRFGRYDPAAPAGSRWVSVEVPHGNHVINGIGADAVGNVWGAGHEAAGVVRINAENPNEWVRVAGTLNFTNKGIGIDADGKVWSITRENRAIVVTPGAGLLDNFVNTEVARTINGPYTYSDMTGLQLRLATDPRGFYRTVFEGCDPMRTTGETDWGELHFDADTPPGTTLSFAVRTAPTRELLADAEWHLVGMSPPETPPLSIRGAFLAAAVAPEAFLEVEIRFRADRTSPTEVITPRLRTMDVSHFCMPRFG